MAAPVNNPQKIPITIKFTPTTTVNGIRNDTPGGIIQRDDYIQRYTVAFSIDGAAPIAGIADGYRDSTFNPHIQSQVIREYDVISFTSMPGGTFEGNSLLLLTDYVANPLAWNVKTHGEFKGTGIFEGQTIVAGYDGPKGGTWEGYLLKP